jgi:uncharacterized membrane protein YkoI
MVKMIPVDSDTESKAAVPALENEELTESEEQAAGEAGNPNAERMEPKPQSQMMAETERSMTREKMMYLKSFGMAKYKEKYGKTPYMGGMSHEEMKAMIENASRNVDAEDGEVETEEEQTMASEKAAKGMGKPAPSMNVDEMSNEEIGDESDDMTEEEKAVLWEINRRRKARGLVNTMNSMMTEKGMDEEDMTEGEDAEEEDLTEEEKALLWTVNKRREARGLARTTNGFKEKSSIDVLLADARDHRIESMGLKWDDLGEDGYVCAIERKSHNGGQSVCDDCPGGCMSEKGLPGLLHIEGLAEQEFKGVVIDSGYSADADMFVVDVQVKDGSVREVFIDGTTAEIVGFHKLDDDIFEKKSAVDEMMVISFVEAAEIAVKSIDGTVIAVEPDVFEGIDSYAVEIDAVDGKSYDVFVGLDGEVLGYDRYEPEEAEDIEAEAAEIALKRAFSEDRRMSMAKEGTAMPDGSYPIASEEDLKNAIQAYGRAKDKEATKRHIMKRAKDMGKESLIPPSWVAGGTTSKKEDSSIDGEFMKSLIEFELLQSGEDFS